MEGLMRISLAVVAVLLVAGSAQALAKKQPTWSRTAPVQQTQRISNSRMRYYGGPKGERGPVMPNGQR
jgi:hypothetical protein